ncbi:MAG TPA: hypothetical protein VGO82_09955 [Enterovirga sp.]|nr:hypothetical protein [Enterovirga sp.]
MSGNSHQLAQQIRHVLAHLIRAAVMADEQHAAAERREALRMHEALRRAADPAALAAIRLDGLWTAAIGDAETPDLHREPFQVSTTLPASCPLTLGELVEPGLKLAELETRIRDAASTG